MKIMFAVHTYYPDKNGVQMVTQYMAEGLAKKHQVLVVTEKKRYPDKECYRNVEIERISVKQLGFRFTGEKDVYIRKIERFAPDILICVCTQSWTFDWLWHKISGLSCKKILYTHGYSGLLKHYPLFQDVLCGRFRALYYHLYWKIYYDRAWKIIEKFDLVTHLSKNNISVWYEKKHNLKKGIILENAVEDIFFDLSIQNENSILQYIYISNYDDNKNQKMVLDAFAEANILNAKLTLAGGGEEAYYLELKEIWEKRKLRQPDLKIEILYQITREQVYKLFSMADVFVCGSKKEQYPLMLCEAAATGLAIISTNVGHAELMPGIILVRDQKEMSNAMCTLAEQEDLRKKAGESLRRYALEHYRIEDKVRQLEKAMTLLMR